MGRPCRRAALACTPLPPDPVDTAALAALRRAVALEVLDEVLAGVRGLLSTASLLRLLAERLESERWPDDEP